jgi:hypothetical protein
MLLFGGLFFGVFVIIYLIGSPDDLENKTWDGSCFFW